MDTDHIVIKGCTVYNDMIYLRKTVKLAKCVAFTEGDTMYIGC